MITTDEAKTRVARGAAHLDQMRPGWFNQIDVGTLTLSDPCHCIIGQLGKSPSVGRVRGLMRFFIEASRLDHKLLRPSDLGFVAPSFRNSSIEYGVLQDAWIDAIADRRLKETVVVDVAEAVTVERGAPVSPRRPKG